jgi:hypothetical protein
MRRIAFLIAAAGVLLPVHSGAQNIPPVDATTLDNGHVVLPVPGSTKPLLVFMTFSHKGSDDVAAWNRDFHSRYETDPRIDYCELADFQGVPSFIMTMILHGMRRSVSEPEKAHLAPIFAHESEWKSLVGFNDPNITYLVLADSQGRVLWKTAGPASAGKVSELEAQIAHAAHP